MGCCNLKGKVQILSKWDFRISTDFDVAWTISTAKDMYF